MTNPDQTAAEQPQTASAFPTFTFAYALNGPHEGRVVMPLGNGKALLLEKPYLIDLMDAPEGEVYLKDAPEIGEALGGWTVQALHPKYAHAEQEVLSFL